ncbi:Permease of the drug/metabolite transporter (DMT) superfamily [Alteromonadaceae bacterium Bs31]|nr:Permease of the drug/metabolite transporter (DMT) superfamily [Alteromonadaceae bacterium Bs31]
MPVIFAYLFVIFIWATTPLAIHWSNSSLNFIAAVSLRMVLALAVCGVLMLIFKLPLIKKRSDWMAFLAGMVGLYPNMLLVYWSAQYISSGMMAIILGIYPFAVGLFSLLFLRESVFNPLRIAAVCLAIAGLAIIHIEQMSAESDAIYGVMGMIVSSFLFALSTVWVKAIGSGINPLRQSTGVLLLAVPAFSITWFILDGEMPQFIDARSMIGVSYLSIAGTVVGHTLFFYVLRNCSMMAVSVIPLITPVMALSIGGVFAGEGVTALTVLGSIVVLFALALYQGVHTALSKLLRRGSKKAAQCLNPMPQLKRKVSFLSSLVIGQWNG